MAALLAQVPPDLSYSQGPVIARKWLASVIQSPLEAITALFWLTGKSGVLDRDRPSTSSGRPQPSLCRVLPLRVEAFGKEIGCFAP